MRKAANFGELRTVLLCQIGMYEQMSLTEYGMGYDRALRDVLEIFPDQPPAGGEAGGGRCEYIKEKHRDLIEACKNLVRISKFCYPVNDKNEDFWSDGRVAKSEWLRSIRRIASIVK